MVATRCDRIRWSLEDHLDALGYTDRSRRTPELRATVAAEVEALTRMEVAIYHADGTPETLLVAQAQSGREAPDSSVANDLRPRVSEARREELAGQAIGRRARQFVGRFEAGGDRGRVGHGDVDRCRVRCPDVG